VKALKKFTFTVCANEVIGKNNRKIDILKGKVIFEVEKF